MHKHSLFFYYTIWMLYPGEHRMLFTGVNEEPAWLPHLPMFPTYTSLLIAQLHFLQSCHRQFPKSCVFLCDRHFLLF